MASHNMELQPWIRWLNSLHNTNQARCLKNVFSSLLSDAQHSHTERSKVETRLSKEKEQGSTGTLGIHLLPCCDVLGDSTLRVRGCWQESWALCCCSSPMLQWGVIFNLRLVVCVRISSKFSLSTHSSQPTAYSFWMTFFLPLFWLCIFILHHHYMKNQAIHLWYVPLKKKKINVTFSLFR